MLKPNGMLLPEKVFLMGQLIYSEDLPNMAYVLDTNLQRSSSSDVSSDMINDVIFNFQLFKNISTHLRAVKSNDVNVFFQSLSRENDLDVQNNEPNKSTNYIIAEYINRYKVYVYLCVCNFTLKFFFKFYQCTFFYSMLQINQIFDLNSSLYSFEVLSDVHLLMEISETETIETIVNFGKINCAKRKTLPNALVCWYKIYLSPDHIHDTNKNNTFMNHTAIVFEDELRDIILRDKEVKIKVYQMKGLVKVTVVRL